MYKLCGTEECTGTHLNNAKYCWRCGKELKEIELPKCICGRAVARVDNYCDHCGRITPKGTKEKANE